jgi:transposase
MSSSGDGPSGAAQAVPLGVDPHADGHVAAALDERGRRLGTSSVPTTPAGFAALAAGAGRFGPLERVGIEGTGSYGAGLARWLSARGVAGVEVDRPDRRARRRHGKSDPVDATAAARAVQAGTASARPRVHTAARELLRALRVARQSAVKARAQAANQLHALVVTAPDALRAQLRPLTLARLVARAAAFRCRQPPATPEAATTLALTALAVRDRRLRAEVAAVEVHRHRLLAASLPELLALKGVGVDVAATRLGAAGDQPHRRRSEAAVAHLGGVAPIPASSGKTRRHRLNRGGDRDANRALSILAVVRMGCDPRTQASVARRTAEGLNTAEILRCVKRFLAREVSRVLVARPEPVPAATATGGATDAPRATASTLRRGGSLANRPAPAWPGAGRHPQGRSAAEEPRQGLDAPAGAEPPARPLRPPACA